jgi:hypothetical protein
VATTGADFIKTCLTRAGLDLSANEKNICAAKNGMVLAQGSDDKSLATVNSAFVTAISLHRCWDRIAASEIVV